MRQVPKLFALLTVAATALTGTAGLAHAATPAAVPTAAAATPAWGTYVDVAPARVLDTRDGTGVEGGTAAPVGPAGEINLPMLGTGGVPATGVSAVVLNLTVTEETVGGFLTVWPGGTDRPAEVSSINFSKGIDRANMVTAPLGADGSIDIYNNLGNTEVIADVMGYYVADETTAAGGLYQPVTPAQRLFDTRHPDPTDPTVTGPPLAPGQGAFVAMDFDNPSADFDVNSHIRAMAVNITAVNPTHVGNFAVWDGDGGLPETSTVNFGVRKDTPNMAIVPVSACVDCGEYTGLPSITIVNRSAGTVHLAVDIVGFFDDGILHSGLRFKPLTAPTRIVDTRVAQGAETFGDTDTQLVDASEVAGVDTWSLVTNTAAVLPTLPTYLTLWADRQDGEPMPAVSNVNGVTGRDVANATITELNPDHEFNMYNNRGSVGVVMDVVGTMENISSEAPPAAAAAPNAFAPTATGPRTWTNLGGMAGVR